MGGARVGLRGVRLFWDWEGEQVGEWKRGGEGGRVGGGAGGGEWASGWASEWASGGWVREVCGW